MPGPVKHAMMTNYNAENEKLSEEQRHQRILGAIIPDALVIEKAIHASHLNIDGHEDYENLLVGIGEHVGMDNIYHGKLSIIFGHEMKEVFDDTRIFLRGKGNGTKGLHEGMLHSIEYGQENIDVVGKVISDMCGTDYEQTREGLKKHLQLVKGYLTFLNGVNKIFS